MKRGDRTLKILDRYVGIPIVFFLGLLRIKRKKMPNREPNVIGFLDTASIGDTVLVFGIIKDIRTRFRSAKLIFYTGPNNYDITKLIPELDQVIRLPINNPFKSVQLIKRESYDIFIDFMSWPRINSLITSFAKSTIKIGFKTPNQFRHYVYDFTVSHSNEIHEIDNLRALLKPMGVHSDSFPVINVSNDVNVRHVVLHMFPSGYRASLKLWPEENWVSIAQFLLSSGYEVSITGGPSDKLAGERFQERIGYSHEGFFNFCGKFSLSETIALISKATLVISVNTGIMHIAAALNKNLIALHGPTNSKRWGPVNSNSVSLQSKYPGSPCLNLGFEYNCGRESCDCMKEISTIDVVNSIRTFIKI